MYKTNTTGWLGKVCVLGMGVTGLGVAEYLSSLVPERVESVVLYGGAKSKANDATAKLEEKGALVVCGTEELSGSFDLAIASPGIAPSSAFFVSATQHATEVIGEPEFAWRESPDRWLAITGTNGKTTTTLLTTELLAEGGLAVEAVGNVGTVVTRRLADRKPDSWFVAELSSFQLETSSELHPRVACLLNISPDHVEWHGSLEAYAAAKERMFANLDPEDLAIVSIDDTWCRAIATRLESRGLRVCEVSVEGVPESSDAAFVRDGRLVVRRDGKDCELVLASSMSLEGMHNVFNALVASAAALEAGVSGAAVCHALMTFEPLEHRIEPCGERDGVRFVNDSKGTNIDAVQKAVLAFEPGRVVVLLGGHDKGTELEELVQAVRSSCRVAICYGEAGPRMAEALRSAGSQTGLEVVEVPHMAQAFDRAVVMARSGDVVLLSPGCSSFDEFNNYQERGRVFKDMVAALGTGREDL